MARGTFAELMSVSDFASLGTGTGVGDCTVSEGPGIQLTQVGNDIKVTLVTADMIEAAVFSVGANATNTASYGNDSVAGVVMPWAGEIIGIGISVSSRTSGTITGRFIVSGVSNTTDTVVLSSGTEAYSAFATPVAFSANAYIQLETVTSGWAPTGGDALVYVMWRRTA